jgi:hypothetical protein
MPTSIGMGGLPLGNSAWRGKKLAALYHKLCDRYCRSMG